LLVVSLFTGAVCLTNRLNSYDTPGASAPLLLVLPRHGPPQARVWCDGMHYYLGAHLADYSSA
jgi:hypothetical protein